MTSLRGRLTLLIALLTAVGITVFVGVAYREVRGNLLGAAAARAQDTADRLAMLFAQSTQQRVLELRQAAALEPVRQFLEHATEANRESAMHALSGALASAASTSGQAIEIWSAAGDCAAALVPRADDHQPSCGARVTESGVAPLRQHGQVLYGETAIPISAATTDSAAGEAPVLGQLVVRRPIGVGPTADTLNGLIGNGATIAVGNLRGDAWTDFVRPITPPPIDLAHPGIARYRDADNAEHLGALAAIRGTPWAVWIEFPREIVLAPAQAFLRRMIAIAGAFTSLGLVAIWVFAGRITAPLDSLTRASEAIAAGEFGRRVDIAGRDEVGRLGSAFNTMAERVATAHEELEARVRRRTARLEETGRLLEARAGESREAREELDRFFSLSLDLLCIADASTGRFIRVNPAWERVLGWTPAELTSKPYAAFVHPEDRMKTTAETSNLAGGGSTMDFENRYRHRDGSYRWLSWKAASHAERGLIYGAARDVTDEKRSAAERERHVEALAAVNQELESFSYSVSHDLRAPLRHITGFAALLTRSSDGALDAESQRYLRVIVDAAVNMGHLIDDLLAFSRVGRTPLNRLPVDLNRLVREVRDEVAAEAATRTIRWRIDELPQIQGDPTLLRLALVNLLANAVKYTGTRASADISIGPAGVKHDEQTIVVRDNGVGFDMRYADKLFGVFQRLHSADQFEGTGIGLATVRRIVQRHGGHVWAEGQVDGGAAFYVSFPINREERVS